MALVCLSPNGVDDYQFPGMPDTLLVATLKGVVTLNRRPDAQTWTATCKSLDGLHVSSLMCEPGRGVVFAGTHGAGLHRSFDGGTTWEEATRGLHHGHVFSLAYRVVNCAVEIFAGTEPAHIYRSRDYGDTWEELTALRSVPGRDTWNFPPPPHIAHVKFIGFDPRDNRRLYVCVEQGALLRSDDDGASFYELHFRDHTYIHNKDVHRVVFNPDNPDEFYVPGGDGITASRDGGRTFEHLTTPSNMRVAYPDQFYIPPGAGGALFTLGGGTPPNIWRETGDARTAMVVSHDKGHTWTQVLGGLPAELASNFEAAAMMRWTGGFGFVLGSTDGEIYASFDEAKSWTRIADGLDGVSKCVHAKNLEMGRAKARQAAQSVLRS